MPQVQTRSQRDRALAGVLCWKTTPATWPPLQCICARRTCADTLRDLLEQAQYQSALKTTPAACNLPAAQGSVTPPCLSRLAAW